MCLLKSGPYATILRESEQEKARTAEPYNHLHVRGVIKGQSELRLYYSENVCKPISRSFMFNQST
jgi:hypothetical protein